MLRITPRPLDFSVFSVAWDANHHMEPHPHEDHELNVAVSGTGRYVMADGRAVHFSAGQILLMPGGWLHQLRSDGPLVFKGLLVHPDAFQRLADEMRRGPSAKLAAHPTPVVRVPNNPMPSRTPTSLPSAAAIENARKLTDLNDPLPPRVVVDPHLYQTLLELHSQAQLEIARPDGFNATALELLGRLTAISILRLLHVDTPGAQVDPVVQRVLNTKAWIDRHFADAIVLDDLAGMANLSPSHFSTVFRQQIGQAPKAYLLTCRLDQAARLLSQTGLSILEIAWSVGFNHLAHFNRSFKAHIGRTPGDYRKKQQKDQQKA